MVQYVLPVLLYYNSTFAGLLYWLREVPGLPVLMTIYVRPTITPDNKAETHQARRRAYRACRTVKEGREGKREGDGEHDGRSRLDH